MNRKATISAIIEDMAHIKKHAARNVGGPTMAQGAVLGIVAMTPQCGTGDIGARLGVTHGAATQLVNALVDDGLILRRTGKSDRRKVELALSAAGKRAWEQLRAGRVAFATELFKALTDAELKTWQALQRKIIERIR